MMRAIPYFGEKSTISICLYYTCFSIDHLKSFRNNFLRQRVKTCKCMLYRYMYVNVIYLCSLWS